MSDLKYGWYTDNKSAKHHYYLPNLESLCGDRMMVAGPTKKMRELGFVFKAGVPEDKCCKKCLKKAKELSDGI